MVTNLFGSLDALLDRIAIGRDVSDADGRAAWYRDFAFTRAALVLRVAQDEQTRRRFDLRLRLAMHLAPSEAIAYDSRNPTARWQLVRDHLVDWFERTDPDVEPLAREIAVVLDNWERRRSDVSRHRDVLIRRDGPLCASCRVDLVNGSPTSLRNRDEYKPYFTSPDELLSIEVDHVEAISALGTNFLDNLQLLCRLCNGGKSDGLGLETRDEARYAGRSVKDIPVAHRARMLYYVIARDASTCTVCGTSTSELTIRPNAPRGGYVRSNLYSICVNCAP